MHSMPGAGLMSNNAASSASTEMGQGSFRSVKLMCKCTSSKRHGGTVSVWPDRSAGVLWGT